MKKPTLILFILNILAIPAHTADLVSLNFKGNIKAASCNLSTPDDIDINLNNISMGVFYNTNSASNWNPFNIELKDCSSYIKQINITFTGTADNADINSLYKNQGTATNIAIQLQSINDTVMLGNNKTLTIPTNGKSLVTIPLQTRAFSVLGNGTAGTLSANITATITYL
ncbi:fimbrial protein [Providencia sp. Je.9.19]|uniref:fimbrial protein n=1 Tax=Providencia sp. Je.9.19 TaxID=3142844 RepID=UPI003DA965C6